MSEPQKNEKLLLEEPFHHIIYFLIKLCDPEKILLFGPCTTKSVESDSYLTLCIVTDEPLDKNSYFSTIKYLSSSSVKADLYFFTAEEMDLLKQCQTSLVYHIVRQYRVLYQKPDNKWDQKSHQQTHLTEHSFQDRQLAIAERHFTVATLFLQNNCSPSSIYQNCFLFAFLSMKMFASRLFLIQHSTLENLASLLELPNSCKPYVKALSLINRKDINTFDVVNAYHSSVNLVNFLYKDKKYKINRKAVQSFLYQREFKNKVIYKISNQESP